MKRLKSFFTIEDKQYPPVGSDLYSPKVKRGIFVDSFLPTSQWRNRLVNYSVVAESYWLSTRKWLVALSSAEHDVKATAAVSLLQTWYFLTSFQLLFADILLACWFMLINHFSPHKQVVAFKEFEFFSKSYNYHHIAVVTIDM